MVAPDPFRMLVDPLVQSDGHRWLDLPAAFAATDAADLLDVLFEADDTLQLITLRVGDQRYGVASRRLLRGATKTFDGGAGHTLPGEPRYELVKWDCAVCERRLWRVHADPRRPPDCPAGCGPMLPGQAG